MISAGFLIAMGALAFWGARSLIGTH